MLTMDLRLGFSSSPFGHGQEAQLLSSGTFMEVSDLLRTGWIVVVQCLLEQFIDVANRSQQTIGGVIDRHCNRIHVLSGDAIDLVSLVNGAAGIGGHVCWHLADDLTNLVHDI